MKVLTIKQPFATLIAEGIKEYEFRTWKTKYRGEFLIHAGKSIDKKAMKKFKQYHLEYPTGCIIAKATLTDCVRIDDNVKKELQNKNPLVYARAINDIYWDGYGFKLENVEKIEPIYASGKLSFWEYEMEE
ncbi:MAG: ASCH domain-containing protein [Clostridia bacterium]|nr:ASCH domain-containing protein [Clostridia bacterium]